MTEYKCGHKVTMIIMDNNPLSFLAWEEWRGSVGFDGDKSMCFDCWCKKEDKQVTKESIKE